MKLTIKEEYIFDPSEDMTYIDGYPWPRSGGSDLYELDELKGMEYLSKFTFHVFRDSNGIEILVPSYQLDVEEDEQ